MGLLEIALERLSEVGRGILGLLKSDIVLIKWGCRLEMMHLLHILKLSLMLGAKRRAVGRIGGVGSHLSCLLISMSLLLGGSEPIEIVMRN